MEGKTEEMDVFEKIFMLGLGVASLTKEKVQNTVDDLVARGRLTREEGRSMVDRLTERGTEEKEALGRMVQEQVRKVMDSSPVATKADIERLEAEIRKSRSRRKVAGAGKTAKRAGA